MTAALASSEFIRLALEGLASICQEKNARIRVAMHLRAALDALFDGPAGCLVTLIPGGGGDDRDCRGGGGEGKGNAGGDCLCLREGGEGKGGVDLGGPGVGGRQDAIYRRPPRHHRKVFGNQVEMSIAKTILFSVLLLAVTAALIGGGTIQARKTKWT